MQTVSPATKLLHVSSIWSFNKSISETEKRDPDLATIVSQVSFASTVTVPRHSYWRTVYVRLVQARRRIRLPPVQTKVPIGMALLPKHNREYRADKSDKWITIDSGVEFDNGLKRSSPVGGELSAGIVWCAWVYRIKERKSINRRWFTLTDTVLMHLFQYWIESIRHGTYRSRLAW